MLQNECVKQDEEAIVHNKKVAPGVDSKVVGTQPVPLHSLNSVGLIGLTKHLTFLYGYIGMGIVNCFLCFVFGLTILLYLF